MRSAVRSAAFVTSMFLSWQDSDAAASAGVRSSLGLMRGVEDIAEDIGVGGSGCVSLLWLSLFTWIMGVVLLALVDGVPGETQRRRLTIGVEGGVATPGSSFGKVTGSKGGPAGGEDIMDIEEAELEAAR